MTSKTHWRLTQGRSHLAERLGSRLAGSDWAAISEHAPGRRTQLEGSARIEAAAGSNQREDSREGVGWGSCHDGEARELAGGWRNDEGSNLHLLRRVF